MHQALQIAEIVQSVFEDLRQEDVLPMAMTCRTFLEPGLNRHWRKLSSLAQILACLPNDAFQSILSPQDPLGSTKVYIVTLLRALTAADLERYRSQYSHRIRILDLNRKGQSLTMFSVAAFQALQLVTNRLPGALSPKLKHFVWPDCSTEWLIGEDLHSVFLSSCVSLFLTKSVECFEIRSYSDDDTPVGIMSLNHALDNLDPSILKALSLDGDEMHPVVRSSIETVRWHQLEQVEIRGDAGVLPMLGCLPSLSRLRLYEYELEEQALPASDASRPKSSFSTIPHSSFPCLTNFHLSASGTPAGVLDVLRCFPQGNAIKELQLSGYESSFPTAGALFNTLRSHMNLSNLQSLTWTEKPSYGMVRCQRDPSSSEFDANPAIDISPLFSFKHLKSLDISINENICLTRAEASQIPICWPEIRDLKLWCHSWRDVAVIDHTEILSILRGCPGLKSLALRFDASTITGDELGPTTSAFRLHSLLLDGDIPISSPSRVLQFLQTVFSTQHLILKFVEGGLQNRETLLFQQRWKLVEERWIDACEDRV